MSKIGVFEYEDTNGDYHEIDIYEPGTFTEEPVEFELTDGRWGVPFLRDPTDADTPFEVQKTDGSWLGVNSVGQVLIDDFEYSQTTFDNNWSIVTGVGDIGTQSDVGAVDGDRVGYIDGGFNSGWSLPQHGFLNAYPEPGDRFVCHVRINRRAGGMQPWILFGGTSDNTSSTGDNDLYEINFIEPDDGTDDWTFRLRARNGTDPVEVVAADDNNDTPIVADTWYGCLVDWYDATLDGRTGVRLRLYDTVMPDPETDTPLTGGDIDTVDYPNSEDGSGLVPQEPGRIGIRHSSTNSHAQWDRFIKYPPRQ